MKRTIEKRLDKVFSQYIRQRDTENGYGRCCSCRELKAYSQLDAGHFINRKWRSTRWNERNVHAQCIACNRFDEGNSAGYALYMLDTYGRDVVDFLQGMSRESAKFSDSEGELMIKDYRAKLKAKG